MSRWPDEIPWHAEARRLYRKGCTVTEIAKIYGKHRSVIRYALDLRGERQKVADRIKLRRQWDRKSRAESVGVRE